MPRYNEDSIRKIREALEEALTEWAYNAKYKSEYLLKKHADLERIAELRKELQEFLNA